MKDKKEMIEYVLKKLKENLETAKKTYKRSIDDAAELPGPMQSRYDTMSIETSWLADGIAERITGLEKNIYDLEHLKIPKNRGVVMICSMVYLKNTNTGDHYKYLILPSGGGEEIEEIKVISNRSPLSQGLFGKKQGEEVEIKLPKEKVNYSIESVL